MAIFFDVQKTKGEGMKNTVLEEYTNAELRALLMEEHFAPVGFVLSRDDFNSIRTLMGNLMRQGEEAVEEAIKAAFYMRMKHTGRLDEVLETHSKLEQGEIMLCILKYEGSDTRTRTRSL